MLANRAKKIVLVTLILVFAALLALVATNVRPVADVSSVRFTDFPDNAYTITLSSDGWDAFTYENAAPFTETVFDGEDAYYYSLEADKEEQYSMDAQLTSGSLSVFPRSYYLGLKYFSRQRETTPDRIDVYVSENGEEYTLEGTVECYDTGAEQDVWREAEIEIGIPRYLRFVITVYYSGVDAEYVANSGVYLSKNFTLTAVPYSEPTADDFDVEIADARFTYDGQAQYPEYTATRKATADDCYFYTEMYAEKDGVRTEPVAAGTYDFVVEVKNDANKVVKTTRKAYTIERQTIEIETFRTVSNGRYAVLLDATFIDGTGREIGLAEAGCKRVYDMSEELNIAVENESFYPYVARLGNLTPDASAATYLYYLDDKNVSFVYDGTEKKIGNALTVFSSYDFGTDTFTPIAATVVATYYSDGEEMESAPVRAGTYGYRIEFGTSAFEGTLTITPKPITYATYVGDASLGKYYDGGKQVAADGEIRKTLATSAIDLDERETGDGLELAYDRLEYARDRGTTYPVAKGAYLVGANASDYVVTEEIPVRVAAKIAPTTPLWTDLEDENGDEVRFGTVTYDAQGEEIRYTEPVYNGSADLGIARKSDTRLVMKGLGTGTITYGDLTARADAADAGERVVTFTLVNECLYDRYTSAIATGKKAIATIRPREVEGSVLAYEGTTREYDGTTAATPVITYAALNEDPGIDDFALLLGSSAYEATYEEAFFDAPEAGPRTVTVRNVRFLGYDPEIDAVFANYVVKEMTMAGEITPGRVNVLTEYIRAYRGQELPDPETDAGENVIATAVYPTYEDALAQTNALDAAARRNALGEFFIRVTLTSANYELNGDGIIPLTVTLAGARMAQAIRSDLFGAIPANVTVPSGGRLDIGAYSYSTERGLRTGLPVTVSVTGGNASVDETGVVTFRTAGTYTITLTCRGNSYYEDASDVTITATARTFTLTATAEGSAGYAGDALPTSADFGGTLTVTCDHTVVPAVLTPKEGALRSGSNFYDYVLRLSDEYATASIDFTVSGAAYERAGDAYVLTEDASYLDDKTYYFVTAEESEEEDVAGFYEQTSGGFEPTSDVMRDAGKTYYALTVREACATTEVDAYFYADGDGYALLPVGYRLRTDETYYRLVRERAFYGETDVRLSLSATKAIVYVQLGGTLTVPYGSGALDLTKVVRGLLYEGVVPVVPAEMQGMAYTVKMFRVEDDLSRTDVTDEVWELGSYTIVAQDPAAGEYTWTVVTEDDEIEVVLTGGCTLTVEKSAIRVYVAPANKYYFAEGLSEESLRALLRMEGSVAAGDEEEVFADVRVSAAASKEADVGDYNVIVEGNHEVGPYVVTYVNGYVTVLPTAVRLSVPNVGHVYGQEPAPIVPTVVVEKASAFTQEDQRRIREEILDNVTIHADVTKDSDVDVYGIWYSYVGNRSNFTITFDGGVYSVTPATITGVTYPDVSVLYDGKRHAPEIVCDEDTRQGLTVVYSSEYFVEAGVYPFTATLSKRNYNDLVLQATLTIGTLQIRSSSATYNAVSIELSEKDYANGINPNSYPILSIAEDQSVENVRATLDILLGESGYDLLRVYDIDIVTDGVATETGTGDYMVTLTPTGLVNDGKIQLFGFDRRGNYSELEYTYADGAYTVRVSRLTDIAFVKEVGKEVNKTLIWIFVAIIAIVALLLIGFLFGGGGRRRRARRISRRRHQRWV